MESLWSRTPDHINYLPEGELGIYLRTAGTVLLGWIIVSSIWHIVLVLFAPAAVSALAVFLICPTTLQWFLKRLGPAVEGTASILVEKLDLSANIIDLPTKLPFS